MANLPLFGTRQEDFQNRGMQMNVQMTIDVIEAETGGVEFLKLPVDFVLKLVFQFAGEKITATRGDRVIGEFTFRRSVKDSSLR